MNRLKLVEKEKENLEGAKDEAEEYIHKEKEIIDKRSVLFQIHRHEAEESLTAFQKKKDELDTKLKAEKEKMSERTAQVCCCVECIVDWNFSLRSLIRSIRKERRNTILLRRKCCRLRMTSKHMKEETSSSVKRLNISKAKRKNSLDPLLQVN